MEGSAPPWQENCWASLTPLSSLEGGTEGGWARRWFLGTEPPGPPLGAVTPTRPKSCCQAPRPELVIAGAASPAALPLACPCPLCAALPPVPSSSSHLPPAKGVVPTGTPKGANPPVWQHPLLQSHAAGSLAEVGDSDDFKSLLIWTHFSPASNPRPLLIPPATLSPPIPSFCPCRERLAGLLGLSAHH